MANRRYSKYFPIVFLLADLFFLNFGFLVANQLRFSSWWYESNAYPFLFTFLNITWVGIFIATRLHHLEREKSVVDNISQVLLGLTINLAVVFSMWAVTRSYFYSREHLFYTYLTFSFFAVSWRILFMYLIRYYRRKGFNIRNIVIVGYGPIGRTLERHFVKNPGIGYVIQGFFDHDISHHKVNGNIDDAIEYSRSNQIDIMFCCLPKLYKSDIKRLIDFAENNLIKVKLLDNLGVVGDKNLSIQKYGNIPVIDVNSIPLDKRMNRFFKRVFDIVFSSLVMIFILSWLIPLIGILIKLESNGSIFYRQSRHGKNNELFLCWKFRTMVENDEADSKQAVKNDPRVTKIGNILRKTSIDELPQFINVFLGDMSVVGPRPHPVNLNNMFSPKIDRFIQRHAVKPGVTGLAQAKGYRGETSRFSQMYGRVKLDRFYVKNWSLILDLKIILMTIYTILWKTDNAY
ncbi:MAG: undecaprenyl-phosphate glucose phosphotransferase [Cyclobacteriaceae bacterium]